MDQTMLNEINNHENLVILQTFSKAWGLAGVRMGMAFSNMEIIGWINKIKPPYNINILSQREVLSYFENREMVSQWVDDIVEERKWLSEQLRSIHYVRVVYPSNTNFILVKVDHASRRYQELIESGIVVRDRSNITLCEGCLRLSIGTQEENRKLIKAMNS